MVNEERESNTNENKLLSGIKKGLDHMGQKTGQFLEGMKNVFKDTREKVDILIKEKQLKWMNNELRRWQAHPRVLALKRVLQKDFEEVKADTSAIKDNTGNIEEIAIKIKEDVEHLILDSSQVILLLENLNFKADKLEESMIPLLPMLEKIFSKNEEMEEFLIKRLGNKWKKINFEWKKYKDGKISKGEFIISGFKNIGVGFLTVFKRKI